MSGVIPPVLGPRQTPISDWLASVPIVPVFAKQPLVYREGQRERERERERERNKLTEVFDGIVVVIVECFHLETERQHQQRQRDDERLQRRRHL